MNYQHKMGEKKFVMSKDLQELNKKANEASKEATKSEYRYRSAQKKIRKEVLKNFDDKSFSARKVLKEIVDKLKADLKNAKNHLRQLTTALKKDRRIVTKKAYAEDNNLQTLKQKTKENWDKVHKLFKDFNIKFKEEHDKWNQ